jgi:UDP-N-acetylglucosamine pyrophosphorylase
MPAADPGTAWSPAAREILLRLAADKMGADGASFSAISAFLDMLDRTLTGESGLLRESEIEPVAGLPELEEKPAPPPAEPGLLDQLAVIKLNGGLGTSMGLNRAKSLLAIKGPDTFLDFIARQILHLRSTARAGGLRFYLMNSFNTRQDTLKYLAKYPQLARAEPLDFVQGRVPRLDAGAFAPVAWPRQPDLEWCPAGHGDLYPCVVASGLLERLLTQGIRFLFVSNADNLGATVDARLLTYFAQSDLGFLMEVARRTPSDNKGGHLARRVADGRLVLRESAQCAATDAPQFQDIARHRFFNTNNLWIRLDGLQTELNRHGGTLPLPLIQNRKRLDPRNLDSPEVLQLETAMGSAIACFARAGAIVVPRSRFSPVKTTADLLALRSDAYEVTADARLVLTAARAGQPPEIHLDERHYRRLPDFDACFPAGAPSLAGCDFLKVKGRVIFPAGVRCLGRVEFHNPAPEPRTLEPGEYRDVQAMGSDPNGA